MSKRCRSVEARCRSGGLLGFRFPQSMSKLSKQGVEVHVEVLSKRGNFDNRRETVGKPSVDQDGARVWRTRGRM
jgi:hypothetical protein